MALDADQASLFVAETGRYRIRRHWLSGAKAGTTEVFVDNLPGFPDNLSFDDGILWTGAPSPRQIMVDVMLPRPWLRRVTYRLPDGLKPKPVRHAIVLGFDMDGNVAHNLQDSTGTVAITTSARCHDGRLFIAQSQYSPFVITRISSSTSSWDLLMATGSPGPLRVAIWRRRSAQEPSERGIHDVVAVTGNIDVRQIP